MTRRFVNRKKESEAKKEQRNARGSTRTKTEGPMHSFGFHQIYDGPFGPNPHPTPTKLYGSCSLAHSSSALFRSTVGVYILLSRPFRHLWSLLLSFAQRLNNISFSFICLVFSLSALHTPIRKHKTGTRKRRERQGQTKWPPPLSTPPPSSKQKHSTTNPKSQSLMWQPPTHTKGRGQQTHTGRRPPFPSPQPPNPNTAPLT